MIASVTVNNENLCVLYSIKCEQQFLIPRYAVSGTYFCTCCLAALFANLFLFHSIIPCKVASTIYRCKMNTFHCLLCTTIHCKFPWTHVCQSPLQPLPTGTITRVSKSQTLVQHSYRQKFMIHCSGVLVQRQQKFTAHESFLLRHDTTNKLRAPLRA